LGDQVKDVRISSRLTNSPACLVSDENDMGLQLQRMLKAAGQDIAEIKPIFELNPDHQLLLKLKAETNQERFSDLTHILFGQAILAEGAQLKDPAAFVSRVNKLLLD
jgi:molecular chaperone HtpG